MNIIRSLSILALIFGVIVLIAPQILAYIIALFFIILGINGLLLTSKSKSFYRIKIEK